MQYKQTLFLQIFSLVAFIEQKENDNNDNLCKIHGGLYIASALIVIVFFWLDKRQDAKNLQKECLFLLYKIWWPWPWFNVSVNAAWSCTLIDLLCAIYDAYEPMSGMFDYIDVFIRLTQTKATFTLILHFIELILTCF